MPILTDSSSTGSMKVPSLPQSYSTVLPAALHTQQPELTECTSVMAESMLKLPQRFSVSNIQEKSWLDHVQNTLDGNSDSFANGDLNLSWAAYHASMGPSVDDHEISITSLLPLFSEDSKSVAMLRHSTDVISSSV